MAFEKNRRFQKTVSSSPWRTIFDNHLHRANYSSFYDVRASKNKHRAFWWSFFCCHSISDFSRCRWVCSSSSPRWRFGSRRMCRSGTKFELLSRYVRLYSSHQYWRMVPNSVSVHVLSFQRLLLDLLQSLECPLDRAESLSQPKNL